MRKDTQNLWNLVEPYVKDAGFELVEVQSGREPTGWVVRLFIDRPAGDGPEFLQGFARLLAGQGGVIRPRTQGFVQGVLGWMIERERHRRTGSG